MSSLIIDFFKNHPIAGGGGGNINPGEFTDELLWYNSDESQSSTIMNIGWHTKLISKPIILNIPIGMQTNDKWCGYWYDPNTKSQISLQDLAIIPSNYSLDQLKWPETAERGSMISPAYQLAFGSRDLTFRCFTTLLRNVSLDTYYPNASSFPALVVATPNNHYTYGAYSIYSNNLLTKFDITPYRNNNYEKILELKLYINPKERLIQIYHDDYLNPSNLIESVLLPTFLTDEIRLYRYSYDGGGIQVDTSISGGGLIIPSSNFNPNVNYTNTSLVIQ